MTSFSKSKRVKQHYLTEMNVIPYIDVMLVLLIIFMITAPMLTQGVDVELPPTGGKDIISTKHLPIVVSVDKTGQYYLSTHANPQSPLPLEALLTQLAAERQVDAAEHLPTRPVLVQGDAQVKYIEIASLMSQLQQIGIEKVGLLTAPVNNFK